MIDLEIQALSETREKLLVEIGRMLIASGFALQRQRLVHDRNGILLTLIVRGPWLKRRALEAALDAHERLISVRVARYKEGTEKPHFAASREPIEYTAPPAPVDDTAIDAAEIDAPGDAASGHAVAAPPVEPIEQLAGDDHADVSLRPAEEIEFILPTRRAPAPTAETAQAAPYVELVALEADVCAVDAALKSLEYDYPRIFPGLLKLERSVAEGARASSLRLAGQRTGAWIHRRDFASCVNLELDDAIQRIAVPVVRALVEVEQSGAQVHIRHSPLCAEQGRSGCAFFGGYLEGLLKAATSLETVSTFSICCCSFGADACVLAISD